MIIHSLILLLSMNVKTTHPVTEACFNTFKSQHLCLVMKQDYLIFKHLVASNKFVQTLPFKMRYKYPVSTAISVNLYLDLMFFYLI